MKKRLYILVLLLGVLCAQLSARDLSKMTSWLAGKAVNSPQKVKMANGDSKMHRLYVLTLVKTTDGETTLRRHGCAIVDNIGESYIAFVPAEKINVLSDEKTIVRMEANEMPKPLMDQTPGIVNADRAWENVDMQLPQAFTGEGVIAGIVDAGLDFTHPAFLDENGQSRFTWFWDTSAETVENNMFGRIYDNGADILAAQHSADALNEYHGTHVLGIEAGRGLVNGSYRGIAYDSELAGAIIIVGKWSDELKEQFEDFILSQIEEDMTPDWVVDVEFDDVLLLLDIKYLFDHANAVGKPCVINLSLGSIPLFDTNVTLLNEAYSTLVGPGRIIVAAAGNSGQDCLYDTKDADVEFNRDIKVLKIKAAAMELVCDENAADFTVTLKYGGGPMAVLGEDDPIIINSADVDLAAINGEEWVEDSVINKLVQATIQKDSYEKMRIKRIDLGPGKRGYRIEIDACEELGMLSSFGIAANFRIDGAPKVEILCKGGDLSFYTLPGEDRYQPYTLSYPSTFDRVISVGAMNYRNSFVNVNGVDTTSLKNVGNEGELAYFSSCGPTLDQRIKPDVVAPGHDIIAPLNSYFEGAYIIDNMYLPADKIVGGLKAASTQVNDRDYFVISLSGTSMATPVVSGIVALWLQAKPDLTPEEIMQVIAETSHMPEGAVADGAKSKNTMYGYGLIDAYAGLLKILGIPNAIENISTSQPTAVKIRPAGDKVIFSFVNTPSQPFNVKVYTVSGQLVTEQTVAANVEREFSISTPAVSKGIYVVQVTSSEKGVTGSDLIRF